MILSSRYRCKCYDLSIIACHTFLKYKRWSPGSSKILRFPGQLEEKPFRGFGESENFQKEVRLFGAKRLRCQFVGSIRLPLCNPLYAGSMIDISEPRRGIQSMMLGLNSPVVGSLLLRVFPIFQFNYICLAWENFRR